MWERGFSFEEDFPYIIFHFYCPNVDWLIVCILLDLIELTPMRVGIDFNSQRLTSAIRLVAAHEVSTTSRKCVDHYRRN